MDQNWIILRTKTFREKLAESYLQRKRIACFLPVRKQFTRAGARLRAPAEAPLFPGYLFVRPEPSNAVDMRYIPGTCGVIVFNGRPATVTPDEIDRIRGIAGCSIAVESHPRLLLGEKIRIIRGPLAGLEGDLVREKNSLRFVVNVMMLNQAVSVEIERAWLEPA